MPISEDADAWVPSLERTQTEEGCRFHQAQLSSPRTAHRQLEGTSVKTRSRNSPVWPGSKVVGIMT